MTRELRSLPAVNRLTELSSTDGVPRKRTVDAVRHTLEAARASILAGDAAPSEEVLLDRVRQHLAQSAQMHIRPAINATGVVLHTGLGRAVLPPSAIENLVRVVSGHSTVEIDVESGRRGSRLQGVAALLRSLVQCEDAAVVNNNAAAVLLAIRVLAAGREVIISRGQLVEIGGQFRIPDVIAAAGARMVEVGTTNKTHLTDYSTAISPETSLLLEVHPSNFRMVGFTESVPLAALARLAREKSLASMSDLGSGALLDLRGFGVPGEPTVQEVHASGVDICTWSGDKLLGGPQCGIITGRTELIARIKRDPMMRVLRVDKMVLSVLEATLRLYVNGEMDQIPTLAALTRSFDSVQQAAERVAQVLKSGPASGLTVRVVETASQVGGGSLPGESLPSAGVALTSERLSADELAGKLRSGEPAVFGRVSQNQVLLDLRTVACHEEETLTNAIVEASGAQPGSTGK